MAGHGDFGHNPQDSNRREYPVFCDRHGAGTRCHRFNALALWLFNIWAIDLPFIDNLVHAAFSILVTLILAHVIWGQTNRYIQQKLEAMAPPSSEKKEDDEEEFGSVVLDRSFTLLPMLRKFVGIGSDSDGDTDRALEYGH